MKNCKILFFSLLAFISLNLKAQDSADSLLNDLTAETEQVKLLPEKMMLTQRIFWGEKGLYRVTGIAPKLTPENRQRELRIRRRMFKVHQGVGIATAAAMLLQGYLGTRLYNFDFENKPFEQYEKIKRNHEATALGINIGYGTTNILADKIQTKPTLKPYHRAAAFTTFAAYYGAIAVMKFEF